MDVVHGARYYGTINKCSHNDPSHLTELARGRRSISSISIFSLPMQARFSIISTAAKATTRNPSTPDCSTPRRCLDNHRRRSSSLSALDLSTRLLYTRNNARAISRRSRRKQRRKTIISGTSRNVDSTLVIFSRRDEEVSK